MRTARWSTTLPSSTTASATARIASAWPSAIGSRAFTTTARLRRCSPSATANSQPIAGLMPWNAPSPASVSQGQSAACSAGIAHRRIGLVEAQPVVERVGDLHQPRAPGRRLDARPVVAVTPGADLAVEVREAGGAHVDAGAWAAVAVMLAEVQHEVAARDLQVERQAVFETMLPVDLEAEVAQVKLARLRLVEDA